MTQSQHRPRPLDLAAEAAQKADEEIKKAEDADTYDAAQMHASFALVYELRAHRFATLATATPETEMVGVETAIESLTEYLKERDRGRSR
jgi:hypothetical protein